MSLFQIAARVSTIRTADLVPDVLETGEGGGEHTSQREETGIVRKTPGKGYCVKSEKNSDWSGGCYPTKGEANKRLEQVEAAKHAKASLATLMHNIQAFLREENPPQDLIKCVAVSIKKANSSMGK